MPSTFFGTIRLLSRLTRTRSSAMTRSSSGIALSIVAVISRTCSFWSVLKVGFSDLHLLKTDQPVRDGNLCVRLDLDRAERGLVAGLAAIGDGAEGHEGCLVLPARDLRLIDEDAAFARQAVHARPAAIDWRRRRSRRGRRLCDRLRRWRGRRRGGRRSWLRRRLTLARRGEHVRRRLHQHAQNRDDRRGAVWASLVIHRS